MDESFTLTISGNSSVLEAEYFPPIELSLNKNYALGLVELLTFNSIPNVDVGKNKFYIGNQVVTIPPGSYEIEDIEKYIQRSLVNKGFPVVTVSANADEIGNNNTNDAIVNIRPNNNTLRSEIKSNREVNFKLKDSIGQLLGFTSRVLEANKIHISDLPVSILKVNALRVECNITTGAYINDQKVHTIHEFFPTVPPGYKIVEVPSHVIYLPIIVKTIHHIQLRIVDQDGELVNFRGETITIRLHLKST